MPGVGVGTDSLVFSKPGGTPVPPTVDNRVTTGGDTRVTEAGDTRVVES